MIARASFGGTEANTLAFPEGVRLIAAAGFKAYLVGIVGRRVLYFGVNGETHAEFFPGAPK